MFATAEASPGNEADLSLAPRLQARVIKTVLRREDEEGDREDEVGAAHRGVRVRQYQLPDRPAAPQGLSQVGRGRKRADLPDHERLVRPQHQEGHLAPVQDDLLLFASGPPRPEALARATAARRASLSRRPRSPRRTPLRRPPWKKTPAPLSRLCPAPTPWRCRGPCRPSRPAPPASCRPRERWPRRR